MKDRRHQPSSTTCSRNMNLFLIVAILTSILHHHCSLVESFSSSPTNTNNKVVVVSKIPSDDALSSPSNRIFVGGISPTCNEEGIGSTFSEFGAIDDILIIAQKDDDDDRKKKRQPYCFVTFRDLASAERAIAAASSPSSNNDNVYTTVQYAKPMNSRKRSNKSRLKEAEKLSTIREFSEEANLIVQVQSTHLDRLEEYLIRTNLCTVLGSTGGTSRNVRLMFLSCDGDRIMDVAMKLNTDPIMARAINKSYTVQPGLLEGDVSTEEGCGDFAKKTSLQIFPVGNLIGG